MLPRTVPEAKPGAGSPNATISLPACSVGGAAVRADAAGTATSAATASSGRKRFTRDSSCLKARGESPTLTRASRERGGGELLEVADQLLARGHQDAVLERAGRDAAVDALDEHLSSRPTWSSNAISSSIQAWSTSGPKK